MAEARELTANELSLDPRPWEGASHARPVAILLVLILTVILLFGGAFEPIEHRLTELRARLLDRSPTGQVAIVEIDAKSLAELSTWPWSRRYHAQTLNRLNSDGAAIVAFDVDFSSPSEPVGDREFAGALQNAQPTILPIFQQRASDDSSVGTLIRSMPAKMFQSSWVGGVNIFAGSDGVVRQYPAATMIGGQIHPSMAALLAENDDFGDREFQPDWAIDAQRIPRFSFVDVMKGRIPARAIAGKRIVIGATAIELGDRYTIPRFGTVPGVVVQALAADSLLQGRAMTRSGMLPTIAGIGLVVLLLGAGRFRRFNRNFPIAAVTIVAFLVIVPIVVQAQWPWSVDSAATLFCVVGCSVTRVLFEVRRRVRLGTLIDADTGLANGRALEANLTALADLKIVFAAAVIDRFDNIRDAMGPEALAELVCETAGRIENAVGQPVYRIAPDTLAWLQPGDDPPDGDSIAKLVREPVQTREGAVDVQLVIGLDHGRTSETKIERALAAASSARASGETCQWFQGVDPGVRRQLSMMGELRRGMERGEVSVAYQPKLDLRTGRITHAEALVRWRHPIDGLISPDRFIPLAESTGVVRELTTFVLRQAIADCAHEFSPGIHLHVAVNVSASDIGREEFVGEVTEILADSRADPSNLTLEVTESAIIGSTETAVHALMALRERGIQLSVDDYGTGQSTLSYVKELPVNELKIDKCFVTSICENENDRIMVRSTIDLAHELGLRVVAEGVEDAQTLQLLRTLGCDYAQGYFIGHAMPFGEICALAADSVGARKVA